MAWWSDASADAGLNNGSGTYPTTMHAQAATYGPTFPASIAAAGVSPSNAPGLLGMTIARAQLRLRRRRPAGRAATYVYDSNPGDADFYSIGSIRFDADDIDRDRRSRLRAEVRRRHPHRRRATEERGDHRRLADDGADDCGFQWPWRTDLVDPNTGAAWTRAAINTAQIGPTVVG